MNHRPDKRGLGCSDDHGNRRIDQLIDAALAHAGADSDRLWGTDPFDRVLVPRISPHTPPLTEEMVDQLVQLADWCSGRPLSESDRADIHNLLVQAWWKWSIRRQSNSVHWFVALLRLRRAVNEEPTETAERMCRRVAQRLTQRVGASAGLDDARPLRHDRSDEVVASVEDLLTLLDQLGIPHDDQPPSQGRQ